MPPQRKKQTRMKFKEKPLEPDHVFVSGYDPIPVPKTPEDFRGVFEKLFPDAVESLRQIILNPFHPQQEKACEYVINRLGGTPTTTSIIKRADEGKKGLSVSFTPPTEGGALPHRVGAAGELVAMEQDIPDELDNEVEDELPTVKD